ncbi:hypothetical protein O1L55_08890 [Streptomyces albulus]|nr:hypothetical protein [Streptomyces noursei]
MRRDLAQLRARQRPLAGGPVGLLGEQLALVGLLAVRRQGGGLLLRVRGGRGRLVGHRLGLRGGRRVVGLRSGGGLRLGGLLGQGRGLGGLHRGVEVFGAGGRAGGLSGGRLGRAGGPAVGERTDHATGRVRDRRAHVERAAGRGGLLSGGCGRRVGLLGVVGCGTRTAPRSTEPESRPPLSWSPTAAGTCSGTIGGSNGAVCCAGTACGCGEAGVGTCGTPCSLQAPWAPGISRSSSSTEPSAGPR